MITPEPASNMFPPRTKAKIYNLEPITTSVLVTNWSAADHRTITLLSYFHAVFSSSASEEMSQLTATEWNTSLPLCAQPPYEVDCSKAFDKVILSGAGYEDVVPTEIWRVLNGAVVGLVSYEPGTVDIETDNSGEGRIPYTQGLSAPAPVSSRCHGLALIRSMSSTGPQAHLLTPLPASYFGKSRILVKGEIELPVWGMLDYRGDGDDVAGVEKGKVPYLQWGKGEGAGGERRRVRRNLMRRAQL